LIVPFFRRFYRQFLKFLLFPLVLSLLFYLFTKSSIAAGFALGTIASIFLLWNWYCNLERAYESEGKIRTGTVVRLLIVIVTCLFWRSEEHTSELQSRFDLVCRLLLEKKKIEERLKKSIVYRR